MKRNFETISGWKVQKSKRKEWLQENIEKGGDRKSEDYKSKSMDSTSILEDIGISRDESSKACSVIVRVSQTTFYFVNKNKLPKENFPKCLDRLLGLRK